MLLSEALDQLKSGNTLHRAAWSLEDGYLKFLPGMDYVWKIVLKPNPNAGNYIFSYADLTANDWQEFVVPAQEPEPLPCPPAPCDEDVNQ